jgi:hypothetical protein
VRSPSASIGAPSLAPSPVTTVPLPGADPSTARIAVVAASSAATGSPRPDHRAAATAAARVAPMACHTSAPFKSNERCGIASGVIVASGKGPGPYLGDPPINNRDIPLKHWQRSMGGSLAAVWATHKE